MAEFERRYLLNAHPGGIRFLAYLNEADLGDYQEAVNNLARPAGIAARRAYRYKYGFGLNWEQEIVHSVGVFSRLGWNDGHNEGWTFTDANYSGSLGLSIKGKAWGRPEDTVGLAGVMSGISRSNRRFLAAGGTDILDGDGALTYGCERILETYPAFNRDRGPVHVLGARVHWEF